jgi:hypothetical protein
MNILFIVLLSGISFSNADIAWELSEGMSSPESIYYDEGSKFVFVSSIAGDGVAKDGNGWIQKLTSSGKVVKAKWVEGLNAPKGMRAQKGVLWVTDIDTVVSIDIKSGKILNQIRVPEAQFLNDIAISAIGVVFVSDTIGRAIYKIENGKLETFLKGDDTESPNGLLIQGEKLIVAAWGLAEKDWSTKLSGHLYSIDLKTKEKKLITKKPLGNLDGLELSRDGSYLVSDWSAGLIYKVSPDGSVSKLSVKSEQGLADIGYIPQTDVLLVPHMNSNRAVAYDLKKVKSETKK